MEVGKQEREQVHRERKSRGARGEGSVGEVKAFWVSSLFGRGKAQVCHDLRVEELKEQLELEKEDGNRQEEEVKKRVKSNQGECAMDGMKMIVNALRT